MNYGEILGKAWKIFWKHKILWVIGFIPYVFYSLMMIPMFLVFQFTIQSDPYAFLNQEWMLYLLPVIMLFFLLGYLVLLVWTKAANSAGILKVEQGQERLSFVELVKQGGRYFWRILGLYSIFMGVLLIVYLIVFACMFVGVAATFGVGMICLIPFFILLIPVFAVGYFLSEQSNAAIIVEDLGVIAGLKRGWEVLMKHFWKIVLMGLILYAGSYLIIMVASAPLYAVMMAPMLYPMMTNNIESLFTSYSYMMIGLAIILPFYMVFTGILYTFVRNAWMLTYLHLVKPAPETESAALVNA